MYHLLITDYAEAIASHVFATEAEANAAAEDITRTRLLDLPPADLDPEQREEAQTDPLGVWKDGEGADVFVTPITDYAPADTKEAQTA